MAKLKRRHGGFSWKEDRRFIAMAKNGATSTELAAEFRTTVKTIARKAGRLGIRLVEIGLTAKK
jgi:hypothetical protein